VSAEQMHVNSHTTTDKMTGHCEPTLETETYSNNTCSWLSMQTTTTYCSTMKWQCCRIKEISN